ncbi:MAG: amidohydrolase family protein [Vicinamibacterales bacterium]
MDSAPAPVADLAIVGAHIVTVDADNRVLHPGSVTVTRNRIGGVHAPGEPVPEARRVIDARGMMLLPGFINTHAHSVLCGLRGRTEDVAGEVSLHSHILPFRARMNPERAFALGRLGALEALRFGATTVVDLYWHADAIGEAFAEVGVRGVLGESISETDLLKVGHDDWGFDRKRGEETFRRAEQVLAKWHGRHGGRFRGIVSPHAPDDCSPELLADVKALARKYRVPITMHVSQSRSEGRRLEKWYGKSSIPFLAEQGLLGPELIASHCVFLDDEDVRLLAESGTWIAHLPMINAKRGYAAPTPSMLTAGARLTIGADNMTADMVMATRTAIIVARILAKSSTLLPPKQAIRLATIDGARALGLGEELGSIEPGKLADLVLVDLDKPHLHPLSDPLATFLHWGHASDVDTVIVDGEIVLRGGRALRVEQRQVLEAAQRAAESGWLP